MLTCWNAVFSLQVWLEEDVELYDFAKVRPLIKKKQVKVWPLSVGESNAVLSLLWLIQWEFNQLNRS